MTKIAEAGPDSRSSLKMHLEFERMKDGVKVTMYGKRWGILGVIVVDGQDLQSAVALATNRLTPISEATWCWSC